MADPTAKLFDEEADEEDDDLAPKEDEVVPEEEKNEYVVDGVPFLFLRLLLLQVILY